MKKILSSFLFIIALCFFASAEEHANDTYAYDDSDTSGTYIDYDSVEVVYADGYYSNYNTVTFDNSMIYERIQREATGMLMIVKPENYIERFTKSGVHMLSFHVNATENPGEVLDQIKALGMKPGLAINPDFPVEALFPYLEKCDFLLS